MQGQSFEQPQSTGQRLNFPGQGREKPLASYLWGDALWRRLYTRAD